MSKQQDNKNTFQARPGKINTSNQVNTKDAKYQDNNDRKQLLEQYKLYVEMMDRVTTRRGQVNAFYISLLSGIFVFSSVFKDEIILTASSGIFLAGIAFLGLTLCLAWYVNIQSYRELNRLKFRVICELEQYLPFPSYTREWEILDQERKKLGYYRLTSIEKFIPLILAIHYAFLLIYSIFI